MRRPHGRGLPLPGRRGAARLALRAWLRLVRGVLVSGLVLSLFPGMDALGMAFEAEGFCVVRGPDVLFGQDVREFHPPPGRFDGIIGGDPCQSHSSLANLVRAKGLEPKFQDMSPEYERVVNEAQPAWFLRENVPRAPDIAPDGYSVRSFLLDNWASLGQEQQRKRRWWFGVRDGEAPELRRWIEFAVEAGGAKPSVTGRNQGAIGVTGGHAGNPPRYSLDEMLKLQGLPPDLFGEHTPFTMQARRKMIGNAVPLPMGGALARAIVRWLEEREAA